MKTQFEDNSLIWLQASVVFRFECNVIKLLCVLINDIEESLFE